jgi:hypothetical protein
VELQPYQVVVVGFTMAITLHLVGMFYKKCIEFARLATGGRA